MIRFRCYETLARYIEEKGMSVDQLVEAAGLDAKLVRAIVSGNYTPSPSDRQRLAAALGVSTDDIAWGHAVPVHTSAGMGHSPDAQPNSEASAHRNSTRIARRELFLQTFDNNASRVACGSSDNVYG